MAIYQVSKICAKMERRIRLLWTDIVCSTTTIRFKKNLWKVWVLTLHTHVYKPIGSIFVLTKQTHG